MIEAKDLQPVIVALESIQIHGAKDIGTMKNVFDYLIMLQQKIEKTTPDKGGREGK